MIKRSESYFKGHNEVELFYQSWTPHLVQGTLVITHGLGEHSESYCRLAEGLASTNWELFVWDLRGHGRSEGQRGVIDNFENYSKDLNVFVDHVFNLRPRKPLVVLGHSMGGLITLRMLSTSMDKGIKALVLSSPLLGIAVAVPKIKMLGVQLLNKYLPNLTLYNEIPNFNLSHDKAVVEEYKRDSLRHDRISAKLYVQMMEQIDKAKNQASDLWLPTLIQQAGEELVVSRPMTEKFFNEIGSASKKMIIYENYRHEVYNEVGRGKVFGDLIEWLTQFLETQNES